MSIEKSIGWTDMTLNPIKGKCQGGCWYCWTKPLYKRKFLQPEIMLKLNVFDNLPLKSKKIFLCSTHDLFGSWISKKWRDDIFANIQLNSHHTFQILTKFPQTIDREMPDNVWLGVSITKNEDVWRRNRLVITGAKVKFISFEPLLERLAFALYPEIDWVIIGKLTGHGDKYNPKQGWVREIVKNAYLYDIPIFLKNNLKSIWGENLIQEFPNEKNI